MRGIVDGRYRIIEGVGCGGMADVYLAYDEARGRDVALKVLKHRYADDEEFVGRFEREARNGALLCHPNIVSFYGSGKTEDGTCYIAMEYLPGGTLKELIGREGPLPPHAAVAVALRITEALGAAHRAGVIHRDVKPQNILMTASGEAKVADFGIARAASFDTATRTGFVLGTAQYISPEQAMGEPVGARSDLYSLGVVLYEMLTGEPPYDAETSIGVAVKHVNGPVRPPKGANREVPGGLNDVTVRLLAKDPGDRYPDADELARDLELAGAGLTPRAEAATLPLNRVTLSHGRTGRTRPMPASPPVPGDRAGWRRGALPKLVAAATLGATVALVGVFGSNVGTVSQEEVPTATLEVPSVRGKTLDEAEREVGPDLDLVVDGTENSDQPEGTILNQDPVPEERVPPGTTVAVYLSGGPAGPEDSEGDKREKKQEKLEKKLRNLDA